MHPPSRPGTMPGKVHHFLFNSKIGDRLLSMFERRFFLEVSPAQPEDPDAQLFLQWSREHSELLKAIRNRVRFGSTPMIRKSGKASESPSANWAVTKSRFNFSPALSNAVRQIRRLP